MKRSVGALALLALALASPVFAQEVPEVEVFAGYSMLQSDPGASFTRSGQPQGWNASITYNLNRWIGIEADASGHYRSERLESVGPGGLSVNRVSTRTHSLLAGPRFTYRAGKPIAPFVHALAGVSQTAVEGSAEVYSGGGSFFGLEPPQRFSYAYRVRDLTTAFGGGFDVKINDKLHWRAFQADYVRRWGQGFSRNNMRVSLGPVFRIGKK
jgi:opacity protein-like surface antigen